MISSRRATLLKFEIVFTAGASVIGGYRRGMVAPRVEKSAAKMIQQFCALIWSKIKVRVDQTKPAPSSKTWSQKSHD